MNGGPDPFANDPWLSQRPRRMSRTPKWFAWGLIGCAALFGLVVVGVIVLRIAVESGHVPNDKTLSEKEVPSATLAWLRDHELIEADERVLYFYAYGFLRFDRGGCFVTNRRVVGFTPGGADDLDVFTADLRDVIWIDSTITTWWGEMSVVYVETADRRETVLNLSNSQAGDNAFVQVLEQAWRSERALAIEGLSADCSMRLESQIRILDRFGIAVPSKLSIDDLCTVHPRKEYEEWPFGLLLEFLGESASATGGERPADVLLLEFDGFEDTGDYARLAERLRDLADGALPIEGISDDFDFERNVATLRFLLGGEPQRWEAKIDGKTFDDSILSRFAVLLAEGSSGKRFAITFTSDELSRLIVCVHKDELVDLRRQTGMDFDLLE